jgi:hypothetical protein
VEYPTNDNQPKKEQKMSQTGQIRREARLAIAVSGDYEVVPKFEYLNKPKPARELTSYEKMTPEQRKQAHEDMEAELRRQAAQCG